MADQTTNLKLYLDPNLTAQARRNLEKLDALGAVLQIDSAGVAQLRSAGNVQIEPNSSAKGGTGSGGSVIVGTSAHDITDFTVYASTVSLPSLQTRARGALRLGDSDSSNFVGLRAPADVTSDLTWTLPGADGSAGQMIKTDGAGTLSWASPLANPATTTGDMLYSSDDSGTLARLGIGAIGTVLHGGTTPSWSAVVDADISASAAVSLSKLVALTASRALVSDASGVISPSAVTSTELGYLSGVTSAVQTQIDSKLDLAGGTLTGDLALAQDPTASLHAATKQYVDAAINGVEVKAGVRVASTSNLTLSGEQTIDGVACVAGDRVLAKDQSTASENGVYVVAAGAWSRASDANTYTELNSALVTVKEGTVNANTGWYQTSELTSLSDSQTWSQFFGAGTYTADGQGIEISGSTFSLKLDGTSLAKSASGLRVNTTGAPVGTTDTQTLSGKSLTGAIVTDYMEFAESAAPTTPASGKARGYVGTDKKLHIVDSTGADTQVGSGSGGELNVISNPDDANAVWTATGSGMTVDTTNTSGELPLEGVVNTGIKITNVSGTTDEVQCDFEVPVSLRNTKLKCEWRQLIESGFGSSDMTLDIKSYSDSGRTADETVYPLSTDDSSSDTYVPAASGKFTTTFDTDDRQYYRLSLKRAAGTKYVVLTRVIVGPGIQPQGAVVGAWQSFTPTITPATSGTVSVGDGAAVGYYRRVGDTMEVRAQFTFGTTGTSFGTGAYIFNLPSGYTINTAVVTDASSSPVIGSATMYDNSAAKSYAGQMTFRSASSDIRMTVASSDTTTHQVSVGGTITPANNDQLEAYFSIPIEEWANSGVVTMFQDETLTEWETWSPTITNLTSGTVTSKKRRVGDSLEIQMRIQKGATGSGTGNLKLPLPTGLTLDTTKIVAGGGTGALGGGWGYAIAATTANDTGPYPVTVSGTDIQIAKAGANAYLTEADMANGDVWYGNYVVPIAEWRGKGNGAIGFGLGSLSNSGLRYGMSYIQNQDGTGLSNNTDTDVGTGTVSIPGAGTYLLEFGCQTSVATSVDPTSISTTLSVTDTSNNSIAAFDAGVPKIAANTWRNTMSQMYEYTASGAITLKLRGNVNCTGGTVTSRAARDGWLKVTRV